VVFAPKRGKTALFNAILLLRPPSMYSFHGVRKVGSTLQRESQALRLEASLSELFDSYDQAGGPVPAAATAIDASIDRCLNDVRRPKPAVQSHLYVLLRAKDLHRYVTEEAVLMPLKLRLLEHILFYRTAEERWAAIRGLLLTSLESICGVAGAGGAALSEAFKRQASLRSSVLGKLLQTTALFNFDRDEEQPPPNLRIRFTRGAFPGHGWEVWGGDSPSILPGPHWEWSPANPLCRWEYLAADLAHALFRSRQPRSVQASAAEAPGTPEGGIGGEILHGTISGADEGNAAAEQMELFPLEPRTFMADLSREVHRTFGPEGVRLFALLLERLSWGSSMEVVEVALAELAAAPAGSAPASHAVRERTKKLLAIVERLSRVRLVRIAKEGIQSTMHASTLLTLLGERRDLPQGSGPRALQGVAQAGRGREPPRVVRLMVDPCFFPPAGNLGLPYRDIPDVLLCALPRVNPYAVGLLVFLRHAWQEDWEAGGGVITRSARQLLHEAGFAFKENARYRAIEAMKRDLNFLQEQGHLGRWRLNRGEARDALDDVYRLESPRRERPAEAWPSSVPSEALVSA
jgi:hypothetical protein